MQFNQKRFSSQTDFEFGEETLKYTIKNKSGAADLEIAYADIPVKPSMQEDRNEWLRNVGLIWVLLGAFLLGSAIIAGDELSGQGFWLVVGLACLVFYRLSFTRYSVLAGERGTVLILRDAKHDEILNEIRNRRKSQLRLWYGDLNPSNDPDREIAKFNWLAENEVLSRSEADELIAKTKLLHAPGSNQVQQEPTH